MTIKEIGNTAVAGTYDAPKYIGCAETIRDDVRFNEKRSFGIDDFPDQVAPPLFTLVRVIPEHLIVMEMPVRRNPRDRVRPGIGGVPVGFSTFSLHEYTGKTECVSLMEHASYASREDEADEKRAVAKWTDPTLMDEARRKWCDDFVPQLRQAVRDRRRTRS